MCYLDNKTFIQVREKYVTQTTRHLYRCKKNMLSRQQDIYIGGRKICYLDNKTFIQVREQYVTQTTRHLYWCEKNTLRRQQAIYIGVRKISYLDNKTFIQVREKCVTLQYDVCFAWLPCNRYTCTTSLIRKYESYSSYMFTLN